MNNNNKTRFPFIGLERRNRLIGKQQTTALAARRRCSATQAGTKARGM